MPTDKPTGVRQNNGKGFRQIRSTVEPLGSEPTGGGKGYHPEDTRRGNEAITSKPIPDTPHPSR